jgi:phosphoribosylanthranilate isomerase
MLMPMTAREAHFVASIVCSPQEAQLAVRYGASTLGFVSTMLSGPGVIAEDLIAEIAVRTPASVSSKMKKTIMEIGVLL